MIEDRLENLLNMTDEEALTILKNWKPVCGRGLAKTITTSSYFIAFSRCFKALEEKVKQNAEKKECDFCEFLDYLNDPRRDLAPGVYEKLSVALVSEHRNKEDDLFRGRSTHYGYTLNYCPECGRRIKNEI